jgi:hypothetical protein
MFVETRDVVYAGLLRPRWILSSGTSQALNAQLHAHRNKDMLGGKLSWGDIVLISGFQ